MVDIDIKLQPCPSCGEPTQPGRLVTADGAIEVWFCSCGRWVQVNDKGTGEFLAWSRVWASTYNRSKRK